MLDQAHLRQDLDMPSDDELSDDESAESATPAGPARIQRRPGVAVSPDVSGPLRAEIERVRRFGEVRRFAAGDLLFHAGEAVPGTYVILSGRVAIVPRDVLGQTVPVAAFAQLIGAPSRK